MIDGTLTLAQIVINTPKAAEILTRLGLDYCCHGNQTLEDACDARAIDSRDVREALARVREDDAPAVSWPSRPASELIDFILDRYHEPLRRDLPPLVDLARKVEQVHADKPTCPRGLTDHLEQVAAAVEMHLMKEEQILFPAIRASQGASLLMPINVLMQEHEDHGENLQRTRALTADLSAPPEACTSWRHLYRQLETLESDLMQHIHLENHVLFPKAVADAGA